MSSDEAASTTQVLIHAAGVESAKSLLKRTALPPHEQTPPVPPPPPPCKRADKDNNTVTIVQTNSCSQVLNDSTSPLLVTVSTPTIHLQAPTGVNNPQNLQVLAQL